MADRTIITEFFGRDRMSSASDSASRSADKLHGVLGKVGGVMKAGLAVGAATAAAGIAALGAWIVTGVKDAASYQTVLAKTEQVIKSTGGTAKVSALGVKEMAAELETMSGVDEELIINSQNVLLTFTNIRNVGKNKIFDMATQSALDMSVALGSDLQGASIQVGKALNDPIKGVSALSKVGVTFTDGQKDVIKAMIKTGDTAGAQKVILQELNKEFGGQAEAAGKGFEGTMARLQDVMADTGREIGIALLPKLTEFGDWLAKKIPVAIQQFKDGWKGVGEGGATELGALAESLRGLSDQLGRLSAQAGDDKGNGFIKFLHSSVNALTTLTQSFEMLGINWRLITATISKYNDTVSINFQKMIVDIANAGAKLPGPMGRHFKEIADSGQREINRLQGKLDSTNTRIAQATLEKLELNLRILGRQKPTPQVRADISSAQAKIGQITAKLRNIPDEYVNVFISEINRDRATAGRAGRASGGPMTAGTAYNVAERKPEVFVPSASGRMYTLQEGGGGGGGGQTFEVTVNVTQPLGTPSQIGRVVVEALRDMPAGSMKIPASAVER